MGKLKYPLLGASLVVLIAAGCSSSASDSESSSSAQPATSASSQATASAASGNRELESFTGIEVDSGLEVDVTVASGGQQSVTVDTPEDYPGKVTTDVSDQILSISQDTRGVVTQGPTITITVPTLASASVDEGASMKLSGQMDSYDLTVAEGASAQAKTLKAAQVNVKINSGSSAQIFASSAVTGSVRSGSSLTVTGGATTSQVEVDIASSLKSD